MTKNIEEKSIRRKRIIFITAILLIAVLLSVVFYHYFYIYDKLIRMGIPFYVKIIDSENMLQGNNTTVYLNITFINFNLPIYHPPLTGITQKMDKVEYFYTNGTMFYRWELTPDRHYISDEEIEVSLLINGSIPYGNKIKFTFPRMLESMQTKQEGNKTLNISNWILQFDPINIISYYNTVGIGWEYK